MGEGMTLKNNLKINSVEIKNNLRESDLNRFPIILKRSIADWEDAMRAKTQDKYFDAYENLATALNLTPNYIRKFINSYNLEFPKINQLDAICRLIGDSRPLDYLMDYWKNLFDEK